METNFNFNSQIATNRSQSERLLALGLKKETADMCSVIDHVSDGNEWEEVDTIFAFTPDDWNFRQSVTPRWSLHRLLCIIDLYTAILRRKLKTCHKSFEERDNLYDNMIDCIEWLIKEGYFNKEYLENGKE